MVEQLRCAKDSGEQAAMAEAARIINETFELVIAEGFIGRTEIELAQATEARICAHGAEPLLAAAENTSMPHASPSRASSVRTSW